MKKLLILLLIILIARITAFSSITLIKTEQDSIVCITDLKYANLIFAEHEKFLNENSLLKTQLNNYKHLNETLIEVDSLRIQEYNNLNQLRLKQINDLESKIKAKNKTIKYWQIGGITISIGLILFLLTK